MEVLFFIDGKVCMIMKLGFLGFRLSAAEVEKTLQ